MIVQFYHILFSALISGSLGSFLFICWCVAAAAAAAAAAKSLQSCPTLCNPIDGSPTGSPVPGILQARTLEWVAISFSNVWKWKVKIESEVAQSCPTLGNPMDCSLPGSSIHGIFQARVLERGVDVLSYLNCLSYAKKFTVDPIMFCVFLFLVWNGKNDPYAHVTFKEIDQSL